MHFRIPLLLALLLSLWTGCKNNPAQTKEETYNTLNSKVFFTIHKEAAFTEDQGHNYFQAPGILLATENYFGCGNIEIKKTFTRHKDLLVININGVKATGTVCIGWGPARSFPIGIDLEPGNYDLYLTYRNIDHYKLLVTNSSYFVSIVDTSFTRYIPYFEEWSSSDPWEYIDD